MATRSSSRSAKENSSNTPPRAPARPEIHRRDLRRIPPHGTPAGSIRKGNVVSPALPHKSQEWEVSCTGGMRTRVVCSSRPSSRSAPTSTSPSAPKHRRTDCARRDGQQSHLRRVQDGDSHPRLRLLPRAGRLPDLTGSRCQVRQLAPPSLLVCRGPWPDLPLPAVRAPRAAQLNATPTTHAARQMRMCVFVRKTVQYVVAEHQARELKIS
ncbi:hypothetical protein AURDEDRAFT_126220 [Auricularia subglabra TFB-10046 SS5]|nr:hypothetical protein AURDEDRAFT_126220 [Auricularia subglabra TFB-10046 SS5]